MTAEVGGRDDRSARIVAGGTSIEAIAGVAGVVLAILGLAGISPMLMAAIACIAVGTAFVFEGAAISARYRKILDEVGHERRIELELGGGLGAEFIGGASGIVLGVLALLQLSPATLVAISVVVFGGTLLLSSATTYRVQSLPSAATPERARTERAARDMLAGSAGAQVLIGIGAIVLGILSLVGMGPMLLNLVALLAISAVLLLSGASLGGKIATLLPH